MNYNKNYSYPNKKASNNTVIRTLYSSGYSSLMLSFYKTNLTLNFVPFTGTDHMGNSQYDMNGNLSTTIGYEGAAAFRFIVDLILSGNEKSLQFVLPCNHNAALIFKYEPDENNQMTAFLLIEKNGNTIPFRFMVHTYQTKENGHVVTKTIQSGLITFAETLGKYLGTMGSEQASNVLKGNEQNGIIFERN